MPMTKTQKFFVLCLAGFLVFALFAAKTITVKVSSAAKNYLDVTSRDFDPTKAKKPNPKKKTKIPSCCSHSYYHSIWRAFSKNGISG
ncbi:MAG: hypothetical protein AB1465_04555 [Patescibacteria group bacterium]